RICVTKAGSEECRHDRRQSRRQRPRIRKGPQRSRADFAGWGNHRAGPGLEARDRRSYSGPSDNTKAGDAHGRTRMTPEEIRKQLEFYQDLGVREIYRRAPDTTLPPSDSGGADALVRGGLPGPPFGVSPDRQAEAPAPPLSVLPGL